MPAGLPLIDTHRCTGCGRCVAACPLRLISLDVQGFRKVATIRGTERCTSCGPDECPVAAVTPMEQG